MLVGHDTKRIRYMLIGEFKIERENVADVISRVGYVWSRWLVSPLEIFVIQTKFLVGLFV